MALTENRKRFVEEYLIDLNATRAYKVAYPKVKKDNVAAANGARLLRNDKVAEYIEKRKKDREVRTEITQDMVINELAAIAFAKATDCARIVERQAVFTSEQGARIPLFEDNGEPVMIREVKIELTENLTDKQMRAIAGIKQGRNGIEVIMCSKERALELLGKHLGMFKDKVEVSGNINNPFEGLTTEQLLKLVGDV